MSNIKKPNEPNKPGGKSVGFGKKLKSLIENSPHSMKDLKRKIGGSRGK